MDNLCVCCGKEIPEGRQVCKACEEGFTVRNRETLEKLMKIAEEIGSALIKSAEAAKEALEECLAPILEAAMDLARDLIKSLGELIAQDIDPKTIPPRSPVRCIGCRPETRNRKPSLIRRGCRHK